MPPGERERRQIVKRPTFHLSNHVPALIASEDRHAAVMLLRDDVARALSPRLVVGQSRKGESSKHSLIVCRTLTRALIVDSCSKSIRTDGEIFSA
jgi:hypothetical protein